MKERIKKIRNDAKMNQAEFAEAVGLKQSAISAYESGLRNPLDVSIQSICRVFNVNEEWLRTGEGEPYIKQTVNQEVGAFLIKVMSEPDGSLKKAFITALSRLDERDWESVMRFMQILKDQN